MLESLNNQSFMIILREVLGLRLYKVVLLQNVKKHVILEANLRKQYDSRNEL